MQTIKLFKKDANVDEESVSNFAILRTFRNLKPEISAKW